MTLSLGIVATRSPGMPDKRLPGKVLNIGCSRHESRLPCCREVWEPPGSFSCGWSKDSTGEKA
jgi:hypothetical protein